MYFGGQIKPEFPVWSTHKPSIEPHQHYPSLAQADSERPFTPALQSLVKIRSPSLQTAGFWAGLGSQWEARACMATADAAIALHPPWQESSAGREVVDQCGESQCHPNRADTIYEQVILIKAGVIDLDKGEKRSLLAEERQSFSGRNSNYIHHRYILMATLYTILKETIWTVVKGFISSLWPYPSKMTGLSNTSLSVYFLLIKTIIIAYHRT